MDDERRGYEADQDWCASAYHDEAPEPPAPRDRRRARGDAGRALAWGIASIVCFGFVFGPLALSAGRRASLAMVDDPHEGGERMTRTGVSLAKIGLAVHLALALSVLPWLLFVLSRWGDYGG